MLQFVETQPEGRFLLIPYRATPQEKAGRSQAYDALTRFINRNRPPHLPILTRKSVQNNWSLYQQAYNARLSDPSLPCPFFDRLHAAVQHAIASLGHPTPPPPGTTSTAGMKKRPSLSSGSSPVDHKRIKMADGGDYYMDMADGPSLSAAQDGGHARKGHEEDEEYVRSVISDGDLTLFIFSVCLSLPLSLQLEKMRLQYEYKRDLYRAKAKSRREEVRMEALKLQSAYARETDRLEMEFEQLDRKLKADMFTKRADLIAQCISSGLQAEDVERMLSLASGDLEVK